MKTLLIFFTQFLDAGAGAILSSAGAAGDTSPRMDGRQPRLVEFHQYRQAVSLLFRQASDDIEMRAADFISSRVSGDYQFLGSSHDGGAYRPHWAGFSAI